MSKRNGMAVICQEGASNRGRVARALSEAILEVYQEGGNVDEDPAVFLILHQLTFLLTGHDFVLGEERLQKRFDAAMEVVNS